MLRQACFASVSFGLFQMWFGRFPAQCLSCNVIRWLCFFLTYRCIKIMIQFLLIVLSKMVADYLPSNERQRHFHRLKQMIFHISDLSVFLQLSQAHLSGTKINFWAGTLGPLFQWYSPECLCQARLVIQGDELVDIFTVRRWKEFGCVGFEMTHV